MAIGSKYQTTWFRSLLGDQECERLVEQARADILNGKIADLSLSAEDAPTEGLDVGYEDIAGPLARGKFRYFWRDREHVLRPMEFRGLNPL